MGSFDFLLRFLSGPLRSMGSFDSKPEAKDTTDFLLRSRLDEFDNSDLLLLLSSFLSDGSEVNDNLLPEFR